MKTVIIVALMLTLMPHVVHGFSAGAPDAACADVSPNPTQHGADPQAGENPFTLTIEGDPTFYVPDTQYTMTLTRGGENFRGFLVVSENMMGVRVGSFNAGENQMLTCSDSIGITHTNGNVDKTSVTLTWTAPSEGTGPVFFRYAAVVMRTMYWANQMGPMLNVCPLETNTTSGVTLTWPLTPAGETSVISCPDTGGNATRNCTAEGVWEQPYVQECFTCPQETNTTSGVTLTWPLTPAGETSVLSCPDTDGNAARNCTVEGVWEQPYVRQCLTCPQETNTTSGVTLTWPPTPLGQTSVISCPDTDGNATRNCTAEGVWEQPYVRQCLTCPQETNTTSGITLTWPSTPVGGTSVLSCPNTDGSATRNCSAEGVWEQPFVCDCLTQGISQQLCNNPGDTLSVLMNISSLNGILTPEEVISITEALNSLIGNSSNFQSNESRQTVLDTLEVLLNTRRDSVDEGSVIDVEQTISDSLNAIVTNTPVGPGETATIRGSGGTAEIVLSRPTVDTLRTMGIQVESQGTTVDIPRGFPLQILGNSLGGGNARLAVTTFSNEDGTFQPQDPTFLLGSDLVDISFLDDNGIVPVSNLDMGNRVMFVVQRNNVRDGAPFCCFYNLVLQDWTSEGCEVTDETATTVTCTCDHLTTFGYLVGSSSPGGITPLGAVLIAVGVFIAVVLIVAGGVMLGVIIYRKRSEDKGVVTSSL